MYEDRLPEYLFCYWNQDSLPASGRSGNRKYVACYFADVGVMVIAVLNAIRALFVKNYNTRAENPCM